MDKGEARGPMVVVTGGSGALGAAACERLAADGHGIVLTYRSRQQEAEALAERLGGEGCRVFARRLDLGDREAIGRVLDEAAGAGRLAGIVHAAGPAIPQTWFSKVTSDQWSGLVAAEIQAFFNLLHLALPRLRDSGGGSIVAVTSAGAARVIPGDALSAVPKAAIEMLIRQVAREEGRFKIRANCVAPGIIDAGLGRAAQRDHYTPQLWESQRAALPLRRFGSAASVAEAIAWLVSDRADYVTGQTLIVDGGMTV